MREPTIPVTVDAADLRMVLEAFNPGHEQSDAVLDAFMRMANASLYARGLLRHHGDGDSE